MILASAENFIKTVHKWGIPNAAVIELASPFSAANSIICLKHFSKPGKKTSV